MRCEDATVELSARLDGAADRRLSEALAGHLGECAACRRFEAGIVRTREVVRLEPAEPVPDMLAGIMSELPARRPPRLVWRYAAAFVAGALVSSVVVSRPGGLPAAASEIPRRVADASAEITSYRAGFEVVERNFHARVPERRFVTEIELTGPEAFRARVTDRTAYPSQDWPRNDIEVEVDAGVLHVRGPAACPRQSLPACTAGPDARALRGREPFDAQAPLPTDVIVPVRTLSGSERIEVLGEQRSVVRVGLDYRDAQPLFAYLHAAGSWRPLHPRDRVEIALDKRTWFPLSYSVRAAGSQERARWAERSGLPEEPAGTLLVEVRSTHVSTDAPSRGLAGAVLPGEARDAGFRDGPVGNAALPSYLAGLQAYRTGVTSAGDPLVSYARGLQWLKIRQTTTWTTPTLYGDVGALAAPVALPGGGVAYAEPATSAFGRRLSMHADGRDLYLESNVPIEELLRVAASLPVRGLAVPEEWAVRSWDGGIVRARVGIGDALSAAPYAAVPARMPRGYRLAAVHLVRAAGSDGVTMWFRRAGAEHDGVGIRVHQSLGTTLPPPMDPEVFAVRIGATTGRYSPERGELEWVDRGVYRSVAWSGLDLAVLLDVASSMDGSS